MSPAGTVDDPVDAPAELAASVSPHEKVALLFGPAPAAVDDLARASGCSVAETRLILQEL